MILKDQDYLLDHQLVIDCNRCLKHDQSGIHSRLEIQLATFLQWRLFSLSCFKFGGSIQLIQLGKLNLLSSSIKHIKQIKQIKNLIKIPLCWSRRKYGFAFFGSGCHQRPSDLVDIPLDIPSGYSTWIKSFRPNCFQNLEKFCKFENRMHSGAGSHALEPL